MKNAKESFFGITEKEEYHLFLFDKNSTMPILIENIGITHPNPRYKIYRTQSNYFIFEFIVSGKGYLEVGGKTFALHAGDVYILEPGQPHYYYSDSKDPFEKMWINFFSDFFADVLQRFGISGINHFPNANCKGFFDELNALSKQSNYSDEICYKACATLFKIVCHLSDMLKTRIPASQKAELTKKILDSSLFSNITIAQLEKNVNLSKAQLIKEFKKYYDTTPYQYLLDEKIKMAKRLLLKTDLNVEEISNKLAFVDPHYFSRIFKKKVGMPPYEYKKQKLAK